MYRRDLVDDGYPLQAGAIRRPDNAYGDGVEWHTGFPVKIIWALIAAAASGDGTAIRRLGAEHPELIPFHHGDAMPFAVRDGHVDAVQAMIDLDAFKIGNVEMRNIGALVDAAAIRGHKTVAAMLDANRRERFHYRPEANAVADAVRARDLSGVTRLLTADTDLALATDDSGNTPMHWAALTGQIKLIDILLDLGADINVFRCDGARPVDLTRGDYHYRLKRDGSREAPVSIDMVTGYLIGRGAEYDIVVAADCGDLGRVKELLSHDRSLAKYLPPYHNWYTGSPLKCAASKGFVDIVKVLLEHGADPNMPERPVAPHGIAMYDAAAHGHVDVVRLLFAYGARATGSVDSCGSFLDAARANGNEDVISLLLEHGGAADDPDPLSSAAHGGDADGVRNLIGAQPNLVDHPYLDYLVRCAAERADRAVIQAFLDAVPNLFERITVTRGDPATVRWLLSRGMQSNLPNWLGWTPMHELAHRNDMTLAPLFLEFGADLDAIDAVEASTPLGIACRDGHHEMVDWLLKKGADPNGGGDTWSRPMAWVKRSGRAQINALLKLNGAA